MSIYVFYVCIFPHLRRTFPHLRSSAPKNEEPPHLRSLEPKIGSKIAIGPVVRRPIPLCLKSPRLARLAAVCWVPRPACDISWFWNRQVTKKCREWLSSSCWESKSKVLPLVELICDLVTRSQPVSILLLCEALCRMTLFACALLELYM